MFFGIKKHVSYFITPVCLIGFIWSVIISLPKGNSNKSTGALVNLMIQFNNFTDDKKEKLKLPFFQNFL